MPTSLFLFAWLVVLTACGSHTRPMVVVNGETMGTTYSVKLVSEQGVLPSQAELKDWADEAFLSVNRSMSTYMADSELSLLNRAATASWQPVSQPLFEVLSLSQSISRKSGGAFDVTVMPLVDLWGFGPAETNGPPSAEAIEETMERIGYDRVSIDAANRSVSRPQGVTIDLSAIAKGYGADVLAETLRRKGFTDFMVEVGGELVLAGHNAQDEPWRIGIETPNYQLLSPAKAPVRAVAISDRGMATSGDYRNYYEVDGLRVSHTIDPQTGRPITHSLASVTVIADSSAEADGWATALNVMGAKKALELAEQEQLAVFLLVRNGDGFEATHSQAFEKYLVP